MFKEAYVATNARKKKRKKEKKSTHADDDQKEKRKKKGPLHFPWGVGGGGRINGAQRGYKQAIRLTLNLKLI